MISEETLQFSRLDELQGDAALALAPAAVSNHGFGGWIQT